MKSPSRLQHRPVRMRRLQKRVGSVVCDAKSRAFGWHENKVAESRRGASVMREVRLKKARSAEEHDGVTAKN